MSEKITTITPAQEQYAYKHCFKHQAVKRSVKSKEYICLECGHTFSSDDATHHIECPNCHQHLEVSVSRRTMTQKDLQTYQIIMARGGYQIVRTFHVWQYSTPSKKAVYGMAEIGRIFIKPEHHDVIIAKPRYGLTHRVDSFIYDADLSIKPESQCSWYDPYRIWATVVYPRQSVIPRLKRNGYCKELSQYDPTITIPRLLTSSHYETLAKAYRFDIWKGLEFRDIEVLWPQVKLMIRHDYHPADYSLWRDTVYMARNCGFDIHSPKYVLPADLERMHDLMQRRNNERLLREESLQKSKDDKKYRKAYGKLLAVRIKAGDLTISPLKSYKEFEQEGKAMHHCVATYFGNRDSLILSVRQEEERIATVELSMDDFSVKQCRAAFNGVPPRYDEICRILDSKKGVFKRACHAT